ncbi:MAG TPA: Mpo1-like protein [Phycisphaerae bacterium]|nr:Mpo1-like protein [Phycisphaerae bacterium]
MPDWWKRYWERHQHPACRVLHIIGVPMIPAALVLAGVQLAQWRWDLWWRPVGLLVLSYLLQWVGHRIEGNDLGEVVFIKKLLGRPYTAISPRYTRRDDAAR